MKNTKGIVNLTLTLILMGSLSSPIIVKANDNIDKKMTKDIKIEENIKAVTSKENPELKNIIELYENNDGKNGLLTPMPISAEIDNMKKYLVVNGTTDIILDENSTTGYVWKYKIQDKDIIKVISDDYKENKIPEEILNDKNIAICGVGGSRVLKIKGLKEGSTKIKLELTRPWEDESQSVETKEFTIIVEKDGEVFTGGSKYFDETTCEYIDVDKNEISAENEAVLYKSPQTKFSLFASIADFFKRLF